MPSRNIIKVDAPDSYYHIYARGASRQDIFLEPQDYNYFLGLISRYLSLEPKSSRLTSYPHLRGRIELNCFCLMPNHFHLLVYQYEVGTMQRLMRGIMTSYSVYFNRKYSKSGPLFESRYKASRISSDTYLQHISRYIHLNPRSYRRYPYSSYRAYVTGVGPEWLQPQRIIELFPGREEYVEFVSDYEEAKAMLDRIKHELAG